MAVPQQQPFVEYASNGIATVFAIPFRLIRDDDLGVYLDGVELTSGFVISNVGSDIGQISFAVAPPSGVLALRREVPLERSTDYQDNGDLLAETINLDFDRLWCALQDMNYDLRRALLREALSDFYDANGLQIKNLADPTEDTDVANKRWVSQFLATLIGGLVIGPVGAAAAVTYTAPDGQLNTVQDMSDARGSSLIGYSADGGVARTVEAKLREIASRADYASDANFLAAAVGKPSIDAAGNLDAPIKKTNGDVITLQELASQEPPTVNVSPSISTSPAYIDQFIDGFFARGMLTTETNGVVTERSITASASAGGNVISIGSNTNLVVGGGVTVLHEDGTYWPYLITALTSSSVTVFPALRAAVNTSGKIERTWFNRAHPGKFYMRYLAQRVARNTEAQSTFPIGRRVAFVEYGSGTTTALGGLSTTTGATLNYYDPLPTGASGTVSTAPRFTFERTAYVDFTSSSTGYAQTGLFALREYLSSAAVFSIASDRPIRITVLDNSGRTLASTVYSPLFIASANMAHRRVRLNFFSANATSVRFRFEAATTSASAVAIGSIEVYQTSQSNGLIIEKKDAVIVGVGDSWIAGDEANNAQRESIMTQLAIELPDATVINSGVGGTTIFQQLASFDASVAVHKPDYVVLNTGTNEAYNPSSATFDPNAVNDFIAAYIQMISKIQSIGARPIILGLPALAQSDAEVPALAEWELLNRSRLQYIRFMRALSDRPSAS